MKTPTLKITITLAILLFITTSISSQIIYVPGDEPTIQAGIDAALDGDTVLVDPGMYVENIDFNGKNITVASLQFTTLDTSYISQTIIDGSGMNVVVRFQNGEDSTAILSGFTIKNGYTSPMAGAGGGIACYSSSPTLRHLTITGNISWEGAGIYCDNSDLTIRDVIITNNLAFNMMTGSYGSCGGGIALGNSNPILENVLIQNNSSSGYGGGICCGESNPALKNVRIINNEAMTGGGISCTHSHPDFDEILRCDIYDNTALYGNDLYSDTLINIVTDTFTVVNPTEFHAYPIENFTFDNWHGYFQQADADLYVSPQGNDANSGLTAAEPLKSIRHAFTILHTDSLQQRTIHLLEGTYCRSVNNESFPVMIPDYITLSGESEDGVILDAEANGRVMIIDKNTQTNLSTLTITGGLIGDNDHGGGGILCIDSDPFIEHVTIKNNSAYTVPVEVRFDGGGGGGIDFYKSDPILQNVTISANYGEYGGGAHVGNNSAPLFQDVIISANRAEMGGGICIDNSSYPESHHVMIVLNSAKKGGGICLDHDTSFTLSGITLTNNSATYQGGGIYCTGAPLFDSLNRCNIYLNQAQTGNDLYSVDSLYVIVDTFTVMNPTVFHATPLENFTFDIQNGKFEQTAEDLFVSPQGNNNNSGLVETDPIRNIQCAFAKSLADSNHLQVVHLLEGTFTSSENGDLFPVLIPDYIALKGESADQVTLDAEGKSGVISLIDRAGIEISDLTVTGGFAERGSGAYVENSSVAIERLVLKANYADCIRGWQFGTGGGLHCRTSDISIKNTDLYENTSTRGGAIFCEESDLILEDVNLLNNSAETSGGGIYCDESNPHMNRVAIVSNTSGTGGGGIYCGGYPTGSNPFLQDVSVIGNRCFDGGSGGGIFCEDNSSPEFDTLIRCNIYFNYAALGNDIFSESNIHVVVDTFTVLNPTNFHAAEPADLTFDILHGKVTQVEADLYVSPEGDDDNSGLVEGEPLKTIRRATLRIIPDSLDPKTIHLQDGTYSPSGTGEMFPILIPDKTKLDGTSENDVILDAEGKSAGIFFLQSDGAEISDLMITGGSESGMLIRESNPVLRRVKIKGNTSGLAGGIYCQQSDPRLENVTITENVGSMGGLYSYLSSPRLVNVIISSNNGYRGGGAYFSSSIPFMVNVLVVNNSAQDWGGGMILSDIDKILLENVTVSDNTAGIMGGGVYCSYADLGIVNSVFWNNDPDQLFFTTNTNRGDTLSVSWSDIQGAESGIMNENGTIFWGKGNIDADPQFTNSVYNPFQLSAGSPCVNAGDPDTTGLFLPAFDLAGGPRIWNNRIDMGAYEWNNVGVNEIGNWKLEIWNYPNPFSLSTSIVFKLEQPRQVQIEIVNQLGQEVDHIVHSGQRGINQVTWRAGDLPAGVYMCRITVGNKTSTAKMLVVR